jgi:hypothetical protein
VGVKRSGEWVVFDREVVRFYEISEFLGPVSPLAYISDAGVFRYESDGEIVGDNQFSGEAFPFCSFPGVG